MNRLTKRFLTAFVEELREAAAEMEEAAEMLDGGELEPKKKGKRGHDRNSIATMMQAEAGAIVVPASGGSRGRIVLVCIDGKPPHLALVVDEAPKPVFKTIRLAKGNCGANRFSRKEHRVLDSEVRRDATLEERLKGLGASKRLNGHASEEAAA